MNVHYYKKMKLPPGYTGFFRDPEMWNVLRELLHEHTYNQRYVFRAWSAGCSTGEEAYSLVSLLQEVFENEKVHWHVYATDIHFPATTATCRREKLSSSLLSDSKIRFRYHHLVEDPPLKHMSIILCRNVLMFFTHEYQEVICKKLYESLRTGGILVLGQSEHMRGEIGKKFILLHKQSRIYKKL